MYIPALALALAATTFAMPANNLPPRQPAELLVSFSTWSCPGCGLSETEFCISFAHPVREADTCFGLEPGQASLLVDYAASAECTVYLYNSRDCSDPVPTPYKVQDPITCEAVPVLNNSFKVVC
ncbi:hypothetical protein BDW02DRAFT_598068 [Decorospora gaudefroyi]|uniref:Uncharacterized protein n=1 Tax=Decorospora gaudefroyi TaxID=184978 RepID=A0A6A5KDY7_9PLEO|nr:hypothetical protein BDW02DRAFT_598068 [Decorospora gaudefroyi]